MEFIIKNLKDLNILTYKFSKNIKDEVYIFLIGDLGVGKTAFVKLLIKNLGNNLNVTSPSFTILKQYKVKNNIINHMDCYRLKEKFELDYYLDEFINAINLIEWPNIIKKFIQDNKKIINIKITMKDDKTRLFKINSNFNFNL